MHKLPSAQEVFDIVKNPLFTQGDAVFQRVLVKELYRLDEEFGDWQEYEAFRVLLQHIKDGCNQTTVGAINLIALEEHLRDAAERFFLEYRR
jgi:hypothetical protein